MAISTTMFKAPLELTAKHFGCQAEIIKQERCTVVRPPRGYDQYFPYYLLKWAKNGEKFSALMEPRLKLVERGAWPIKWEQYEIDNDAMRQEVIAYLSR